MRQVLVVLLLVGVFSILVGCGAENDHGLLRPEDPIASLRIVEDSLVVPFGQDTAELTLQIETRGAVAGMNLRVGWLSRDTTVASVPGDDGIVHMKTDAPGGSTWIIAQSVQQPEMIDSARVSRPEEGQ